MHGEHRVCCALGDSAASAGPALASFPQRVLEDGNPNFGYNAATGKFEDLMAAGIIDPAKVRLLPNRTAVGLLHGRLGAG